MIKLITLTILISFATLVSAKTTGRFVKYKQVTDKQVIIESTKGVKVLFTAFDNNSIGVTYSCKEETISLIAPSKIDTHHELGGSIYVEELDDLMQITTTTNDGLMIQIDTKKFGFTFIDKTSREEIALEEELIAGIYDKRNQVCFLVDNRKELELVAQSNF